VDDAWTASKTEIGLPVLAMIPRIFTSADRKRQSHVTAATTVSIGRRAGPHAPSRCWSSTAPSARSTVRHTAEYNTLIWLKVQGAGCRERLLIGVC